MKAQNLLIMKRLFPFLLILFPFIGSAQLLNHDSLSTPLLSEKKEKLLKNVNITLGMRFGMRGYMLRGGDHDYQGAEFENQYTAIEVSGKVYKNIHFYFRDRFNKNNSIQTLDQLGSNIELAYLDIVLTPKWNIQLGKQSAFFGGYEYAFSPMDILKYNDIHSNALSYVTGVGMNYQLSENHALGFQILNSRTMLYEDLYGEDVAANIEEPDWPVEFVGRWNGNFFDKKLETIYSVSYSRQVKNMGTFYVTLGHKYRNRRFTIMYDFSYSYEQVDTKNIATDIIGGEYAAQDVTYIGNWLRTKYKISPQFSGLLTLMTSTAYGEDVESESSGRDRLRTSYGIIPTLYYHPFQHMDIRFFVAYIGRYFAYSKLAKDDLGSSSYNRNEVRLGIIAPLWIL